MMQAGAQTLAKRTRRWRASAAVAGLSLLAAVSVLAGIGQATEAPRPIAVKALPIASFDVRDEGRQQFGALEFRGGLELLSNDRVFGGLSALRMTPDGAHFISTSDRGRWFRGRILYRDGRPAAVDEVETAPMLDWEGHPLAERGWYDTESLAQDGGTLYVGIEKVNEIVRFDYGKDGLLARAQPVAAPPAIKTLPRGKSLEALAFVPAGQPLGGTLIAISEHGLDSDGNIRGFLIGGPKPGAFAVKRSRNFDVSDATLLPDGDLLLLERSFSALEGVGMRIRRVAQKDIAPDALVDGRVLIEADLGYQIDNMEGIAAHRNAKGEIILTVISDDNFSSIQRTILLQFAMVEP